MKTKEEILEELGLKTKRHMRLLNKSEEMLGLLKRVVFFENDTMYSDERKTVNDICGLIHEIEGDDLWLDDVYEMLKKGNENE